jgi:hypothetical protein
LRINIEKYAHVSVSKKRLNQEPRSGRCTKKSRSTFFLPTRGIEPATISLNSPFWWHLTGRHRRAPKNCSPFAKRPKIIVEVCCWGGGRQLAALTLSTEAAAS